MLRGSQIGKTCVTLGGGGGGGGHCLEQYVQGLTTHHDGASVCVEAVVDGVSVKSVSSWARRRLRSFL